MWIKSEAPRRGVPLNRVMCVGARHDHVHHHAYDHVWGHAYNVTYTSARHVI
jgi:hypothetical protein